LTFSVLENNGYNNALVIAPSGEATFSDDVTISNTDALLNLTSGASNDSVIRFNQDTTQRATIGYDDTGDLLKINNNSNFGGTSHLTIDTSGNATFAGNIVVSSGVIQLADLAQSIDFIQSGAINYDSNNDQTGREFKIGTNRSAGSSGGTTNLCLDENSRISLSNNDSGTSNTVFGYGSGANIDAGSDENVFIGHQVSGNGTNNNSLYNVGIGFQSLFDLAGGDGNVAIGHKALFELDEGQFNVSIGKGSLQNLTSGSSNVAIGTDALGNPTTAEDIIAIGRGTAYAVNNDTADGAVAIGRSALAALTSGAGNIAVGYEAMNDMQTGTNNIALGYQAMDVLQGGDGSGGVAASANGGNHNIAIGTDAMGAVEGYRSTTEIDGNIAIGTNALLGGDLLNNNIDFVGNIAIGYNAVDATGNAQGMTGTIGIGYESLTALTSGANNTAVGFQSLHDVNTGGSNVALGNYAGDNITDGTENTCIGYAARTSATGSTNQTVIGRATTGVQNNSVTLGNSSVTDVFMGSDSGALVNCSGIAFPGTQVPSGGANALDDYEEGDWTPILSDGSNNFTMASNQNGRYTKIGRAVHFEAECGTSSIGSASGDLKLIGLPFTSASSTSEGSCSIGFLRAFNYSSDTIQLMVQVNGNTTEIGFTASKDDATEETVQCSQADSSSFFIRISGTYFV